MHNDNYGRQILTETDICNAYLRDPRKSIDSVISDRTIEFSDILEIENLPQIIKYDPLDISVEEFDIRCQSNWHMPKDYNNLDIAKWVLDCCKTDEELQRVGQELLLFQEHDLSLIHI